MSKRLVFILAWIVRVVVIGVILATIVIFLFACSIAAGIGGGM